MTSLPNLQIGGYETLSTVDWPGKLVSTIFCQGCPWKCTYCFNKDILDPRKKGSIPFQDVIKHLEKRKGILSGVVFSGGDALMQGETTIQAMKTIKEMGFQVGLHCDGAYPKTLEKALPLLDWVGQDIKGLPFDYSESTLRPNSGEKAWSSLNLLLNSNVEFEVRTTVSFGSITADRLYPLAEILSRLGVKEWHIQNAQGPQFNDTPVWRRFLEVFQRDVSDNFEEFSIRL